MRFDYRADIDWLRALAVIAVIGFHFEITGFRGGFVGVDVFFVISGFLIGRIVQAELAAGTFSFLKFYERRIRRLVPALYVMLVVAALIGWGFLFGSERSDFLRSIVAVATFTSNIIFWTQSGYFDRASSEKPLLHTWSLGIEEQFYILLPVLLWAIWRWRNVAAVRLCVGALTLASFWVSCSLTDRGAAFFLIQSRAWELLVGVMVVWIPTPRQQWLGHAARVLGITLIVIAVLAFPPGVAFPGTNALLPVLGAAVFICGGPLSWRVPPIELIGRMSYSLYLWHWPIYTLAKMRTLSLTLTMADKVALLCALVAVSYASYRWIERPARSVQARPKVIFTYAAAATVALLLFAAVSTWLSSFAPYSDKVASLKTYEALTGMERTGTCYIEDWTTTNHPECFTRDARPTVLLWGDSLADQYMPGLSDAAGQEFKVLQANAAGCFPTLTVELKQYGFCDTLASRVIRLVTEDQPRIVVISGDWVGYGKRIGMDQMAQDLKTTVAKLGLPVVLIGPSVQFKGRLPSMLMRAAIRGSEPISSSEFLLPGLFDLDRSLKTALSDTTNLTYLSALDSICPLGNCPLTVEGGIPLTWDHGHLTATASRYVARSLAPTIFGKQISQSTTE